MALSRPLGCACPTSVRESVAGELLCWPSLARQQESGPETAAQAQMLYDPN